MDFEDELPCGGYQNEDAAMEREMKEISEGGETKAEGCEKSCEKCECKKEAEIEEPKKRGGQEKVCKKCSAGRAILLHKGEPICEDCLFKNMEYKSRLLLENTFKVNKESKLLLCFSGGLNSIAMVTIIHNIFKKYQKNKLFHSLACIHVQQQTPLTHQYLQLFKEHTGLELNLLKLEDALDEGNRTPEAIKNLLGQFNRNANSIDLLRILRDRLITDYANQHGFTLILKGLNGESLATECFRYFAKGLGGNINTLCAGENQGPFYPLRNHLQKELQYYFHTKKLSVISIKDEENDNLEALASKQLDTQIGEFIGTLQQMYSHTAPAIVRTAEKIETNLTTFEPCQWCSLPGADQLHLCRRCLRIWESRKKTLTLQDLPLWMRLV